MSARHLLRHWVLVLAFTASCGSVSANLSDGGDAGGGGAGQGGGGGGGGQGGGSGGAGGTGQKAVTLRLVIPAGRSFCDQTTACASPARITIRTAAGQSVDTSTPWCSTICSSACTPSPCPAIACISQGVPVKTMDFQWDGAAYVASTCGAHVSCEQPTIEPAGHYVAHMCATPGTLSTADGGFPSTCTATGAVECVDVPFDLPGPSVVEGMLP